MVANVKLAGELERIILGRLANGKLKLPAMPTSATKCMELLRDPDFNQKKVIALIEVDPLLAATVIGAGNTANHGGGGTVKLEHAFARLGAQRVKTVIVEYAAHELFQSTDKRIAQANRKVWEHSVAVALLARDIAALTGETDGDVVYLAGLLHDIGKPVLAAMLLEAERQLTRTSHTFLDSATWGKIIEERHRTIGVAIANEWKLADEIASAIRDCNDYDAGDRKSAANIVRFANAIAKREGYATGAIDAADVDAMIMVGRSMLGADEALVTRLATGLRDRIGQIS